MWPPEHDKPVTDKLVGDNPFQEEVENHGFIVMCYTTIRYVDALF